jgi:hypothetical protein
VNRVPEASHAPRERKPTNVIDLSSLLAKSLAKGSSAGPKTKKVARRAASTKHRRSSGGRHAGHRRSA